MHTLMAGLTLTKYQNIAKYQNIHPKMRPEISSLVINKFVNDLSSFK